MKCLLFFLSLLFTNSVFSQMLVYGDSVTVSKEFLIRSANKMQNLQTDLEKFQMSDSLKTETILRLETLNIQTQAIVELKDTELEMYRGLANRFIELPPLGNPKWHESKTFNFVAGVVVGGLVIYSGAYIVSKIN